MTALIERATDDRTIELSIVPCRVVHERYVPIPQFETDSGGKTLRTGVIREREYVVQLIDGLEDTLCLRNREFQARPGNVLSVVYGLHKETWHFLGVKNHDNGMVEIQPNDVTPWFRAEVFAPPALIGVSATALALSWTFAHVSWWVIALMTVSITAALVGPISAFAKPYWAERRRVQEFIRGVPRPSDKELPPVSNDARSVIHQQFNAPNYGTITQNNYIAQSFPADELRSLLQGRNEAAAIDVLEEELRSPTPQRSRVLSALENLRGVADSVEIVRVLTAWLTNPDVQAWIGRLITH